MSYGLIAAAGDAKDQRNDGTRPVFAGRAMDQERRVWAIPNVAKNETEGGSGVHDHLGIGASEALKHLVGLEDAATKILYSITDLTGAAVVVFIAFCEFLGQRFLSKDLLAVYLCCSL